MLPLKVNVTNGMEFHWGCLLCPLITANKKTAHGTVGVTSEMLKQNLGYAQTVEGRQ
jgi:hypothetical protein